MKMAPNRVHLVLVLSLLVLGCLVLDRASALVDYCSTNTFGSNSTHLQFTKEVSGSEYAVASKFKSLHCCAKGYRSIEWYKDNRAYPWPADVSSFILYPEAANQTIYTQKVSPSDRGNYTCIVSNDTHMRVHTIQLDVVDKPPDAPKATFTPADQWVELGGPARLYCEAFVGRINLPDARSDVWWTRVKPQPATTTASHLRQIRLQQDKVTREDDQILGAYLLFNNVKSEDYGQYICTVGNAESFIEMPIWLHHKAAELPIELNSVPWRNLCFVVIGVVLSVVTVIVIYAKLGLKVALKFRNTFTSTPVNDGKEYDILVIYMDINSSLVNEGLVPILQHKYNYKCVTREVPTDTSNWNQILFQVSRQSRSLVAVLSPKHYTIAQLNQILAQLHVYSTQPTVVLLQNMPHFDHNMKNDAGHNLMSLLRRTKLIPWRNLHDKHFWLNIRLALPPPTVSFGASINASTADYGRDKRCYEMPPADVIHMKESKEGNICKSTSTDVLV